jgi:hypothetical protein
MPTHLLDLPRELLALVAARLPYRSVEALRCVCRTWSSVVHEYSSAVSHRRRRFSGRADAVPPCGNPSSVAALRIGGYSRSRSQRTLSDADLVGLHARFPSLTDLELNRRVAVFYSSSTSPIRATSRLTRLLVGNASALAYAMAHPHLKRLTLNLDALADSLPLRDLLRAAPGLASLRIDGASNDCITSGLAELATSTRLHNLKALHVARQVTCDRRLSDDDPKLAAVDWTQLADLFPCLATLTLAGVRHVLRGDGRVALPHLTSLYVGDDNVPAALWERLQSPSLTRLKACSIDGPCMKALLAALEGGRMPQLQTLIVDAEYAGSTTERDWTVLAAAVPHLRTVHLAVVCLPCLFVTALVTRLRWLDTLHLLVDTEGKDVRSELEDIDWPSVPSKRLLGVLNTTVRDEPRHTVQQEAIFTERGILDRRPWSAWRDLASDSDD